MPSLVQAGPSRLRMRASMLGGIGLTAPFQAHCAAFSRHLASAAHKGEPDEYLFSANARTRPTMTVGSGGEFTVEVRGAFDDVDDISAVPTQFTPACGG